ncbi:MAG: hypothetical protein ACM3H8_02955, partial [Sphingobacteriales bacterium]
LNLLPAFAVNRDSISKKEPDSATGKSIKKVCTCELVKLSHKDYKTETVALFAEKTNEKNIKLDYKITAFELWKEKKYLEKVFVYDVELIKKYKEATDCTSLFEKLKLKYTGLKMNSIIDIDIRSLVTR